MQPTLTWRASPLARSWIGRVQHGRCLHGQAASSEPRIGTCIRLQQVVAAAAAWPV